MTCNRCGTETSRPDSPASDVGIKYNGDTYCSSRCAVTEELKDKVSDIRIAYFSDEISGEEAVEKIRELKNRNEQAFHDAFLEAETLELETELLPIVEDTDAYM